MKIFITGGSGYIGSRLAQALAAKGNQVNVFIRPTSSTSNLSHPNIHLYYGDITDPESLSAAMKDCRQVYHLAALAKKWDKNRNLFYKINVGGTENVLEAALKEGVSKFVYTSSCGVWSSDNDHIFIEKDPRVSSFDNDYDLSKYLAEKLVREYCRKGLFTIIVNPPRVYGPGPERYSNAVNRFISLILNHKVVPMLWNLDAKANYAFIDDVVNGHIIAMEKGLGGERYVLGGENISYKKLIKTVLDFSGSATFFIRMPPFIFQSWAAIELMLAKITNHYPVCTPDLARRLQMNNMFDCAKAIKQLGYGITSFEEGMRITIDYPKQKNMNPVINNHNYTFISGASEGLGKAFAIECASRKMNLILVALPGIELYQLASYIRRKYSVLVYEFETDLSDETNRISLLATIREKNISINMMINNAGVGGSVNFDECDFDYFKKQISLNVFATVHLTHLLLPELKKHVRSYILNVSSLCIFFYLIHKQVYGTTKSFIHFFSKSLGRELKKDGVQVSVVCPGGMNSNPFFYMLHRRSNWLIRSAMMDPEKIAPISIDGLLAGKEKIIPGKWNRFFLKLDRILPGWVKERMTTSGIKNYTVHQITMILNGKTEDNNKAA